MKNIGKMKDDLTKVLILGVFWDMVQAAKLTSTAFMDFLLKYQKKGKNLDACMLATILKHARVCLENFVP